MNGTTDFEHGYAFGRAMRMRDEIPHDILGPEGEVIATDFAGWIRWWNKDYEHATVAVHTQPTGEARLSLMRPDTQRRVAFTRVSDASGETEVDVSTVFLGVNHNWNPDGPPILFETMVFGSEAGHDEMERYHTWDEAVAGHERMVARVRAALEGSPGTPD